MELPSTLLDVEVIGVGNDAGGMHHLIENHHVILGLHQLHVVVVGSRYHRWATDEAVIQRSTVVRPSGPALSKTIAGRQTGAAVPPHSGWECGR